MHYIEEDLVSIITPSYNRSHILKETIRSVLNQTYKNFEYLIIDDGSTDNTKEIISSFNDNRIKYIYQEHTGRPAPGRNYGIRLAKGKFLAFLDSDDLWFSSKLEKQVELLNTDQNIFAVSTNGLVIPKKPYRKYLSIKNNKTISFNDLLIKRTPIIASSIIIRKSVINEIGDFDEDVRVRAMEDYDLWLRILKHKDYSIMVMKDILVKYRLHQSNISIETDPIFLKKRYQRFKYVNNKYKKNESNPLEFLLRITLLEYRTLKIRQLLFYNKIKLKKLLKDNWINPFEKIKIIFGYFSEKYFSSLKETTLIKNIINFVDYIKYRTFLFLENIFDK